MGRRGKRYKELKKAINAENTYLIKECIQLIKSGKKTKFDETVDISINLGVDPKQSDQIVKGVVNLPSGTGKKIRVAVFAKDNKKKEAEDAGADYVGAEDLALKFEKENLNVDRVLATPDMMALVGKLGKVLGPKGLMPNPKMGSVTQDVSKAIEDIKKGQIEFKTDKSGIVHAGIGKLSFSEDKIEANIVNFIEAIIKAKPSGSKGTYLKDIYVSTTMGPSIKIANK